MEITMELTTGFRCLGLKREQENKKEHFVPPHRDTMTLASSLISQLAALRSSLMSIRHSRALGFFERNFCRATYLTLDFSFASLDAKTTLGTSYRPIAAYFYLIRINRVIL